MAQYKLSELNGFDSILPNDSIIMDFDDDIVETYDLNELRMALERKAAQLNCDICNITSIENFQPPTFSRQFYDTILFKQNG